MITEAEQLRSKLLTEMRKPKRIQSQHKIRSLKYAPRTLSAGHNLPVDFGPENNRINWAEEIAELNSEGEATRKRSGFYWGDLRS